MSITILFIEDSILPKMGGDLDYFLSLTSVTSAFLNNLSEKKSSPAILKIKANETKITNISNTYSNGLEH